ncbi:hypothetical protein PLESTB_000339300 [Pleodorina starrii]|uniref:Uncharacterized protein n=1 Tax=Pleodorina starrii TaxID=330485 RepID=A0A9W6BDH1_9CHLO|nr:hypothetical protein PLESTB_000339300 [Pleodorina starrii]GLC73143.1 hypothetical protein PLESTF_001336800 [Pleodorina starrii]
MAEPVARPIRKIKLKFGKQLLATHVVRVPGLGSSASHDSKDAKPGSALHLARLRQASLQGYVPPSASADAIVARLRDGEGFAPGAELPPWDFTAPPVVICQERPAKRLRQQQCPEERVCSVADTGAAAPRREGLGLGPGRAEPVLAHEDKGLPVKVNPTPERIEAAVGGGESNSDQATNSQAYLPLSPDDAGDATVRATVAAGGPVQPRASSAGHSSLATTAQLDAVPAQRPRANPSAKSTAAASLPLSAASALPREARASGGPPRPASARAAGSCSPLPAPTARGDIPSTSGRQQPSAGVAANAVQAPSGVSIETQTSQRDFPVLPLSFLELPRLCGTALSFQSIGPFDLQLEREQRIVLTEGSVEAHVEEAKRVKRQGDVLMTNNSKQWSIKALSKYIIAALMFMEAADAMLARDQRRDQRHNLSWAANMYRQTADLLVFTVTSADTLKGNGIGKEALRLLAERLCAICLLRQTSLMAGNIKACADKAQAALREHQRQQSAHGAGAGAAAGASGSGQQPSPEDSSTSSLHAGQVSNGPGSLSGGAAPGGAGSAHGSGGGVSQPLAGFGHEQVSELLSYARTTYRFSEFMKRSSKSFEAFLERPDVRQDQQAKLVCMHLAAVCMDVGMTPGTRVIHHAREAVRTMCEDLAR